jgi:hypothetical protein
MSISIGEYLLARLWEMGVRHMFGVPGDFNLWFLEQTIKDSSIDFVGCCNELNAAYAADGCSRLAGISALAVTYGVGELASLSGVAELYQSWGRHPISSGGGVCRRNFGSHSRKSISSRLSRTAQRTWRRRWAPSADQRIGWRFPILSFTK